MGSIRPFDEKRTRLTVRIARPSAIKESEKLAEELNKLKARVSKSSKS